MTTILCHLIRVILRFRPRPHPPLSPGARARIKQELMEAARQEPRVEWYWLSGRWQKGKRNEWD